MRKIIISLTSLSFLTLTACTEQAPTVAELIENDDLFKKTKMECKSLGDKQNQLKVEKCVNYMHASDKRRSKFTGFSSLTKKND